MRKMTIAFGQIFNNIQIKRKDSSGAVIQSIKVPLAYAPKEKFLVRLDQQPSLSEREFAITLPRLGFEISGIEYDASRKLTKVQKFKHIKDNIDGKAILSTRLYCNNKCYTRIRHKKRCANYIK
jgi:hypothetical protein